MAKSKYQRTFEELDTLSSKFWPSELSEREADISIIPLLLESQEKFISILSVGAPDIDRLFTIVDASGMAANLFLKHLVILADFGGELLKRISREFESLFPDQRLRYYQNGTSRSYQFRAIPLKKFNNKSLGIEGKQLLKNHKLDDLKKDAIAILMFGSSYSGDAKTALALAKCEIGDYLGKQHALSQFISQRYIWVSRITGGAKANNLGQLAQKFVIDYINKNINLPGVTVKPSGRLTDISHTDPITGRDTAFDIVVSNGQKHIAIEVSFQVTTNSTIERKSGQARDRYTQIEAAGHRIAYVIDGSGNFERESALKIILAHSHCSVAFSNAELDVLCEFLRDFLI